MRKSTIIQLLITLLISFSSCSKEDVLGKYLESSTDSYIKFKYNQQDYNISSVLTGYTKVSDSYYTLMAIDMKSDFAVRTTLNIVINQAIEAGKTYPIYSGTTTEASSINVLFTAPPDIADQSQVYSTRQKIGELKVETFNSERITGTFNCEMMKGQITNGEFSLAYTEDY